jgi:hypothetical protein
MNVTMVEGAGRGARGVIRDVMGRANMSGAVTDEVLASLTFASRQTSRLRSYHAR